VSYVVDASIAFKWLVEEEDSAEVAELMRLPVRAPDLLVLECANALWKKVRRRELDEDEALAAARALRSLPITLEPVSALAPEIVSLSLRLSHPAYDCAYLALAISSGDVLITADERFLSRCLQAPDLAPHVRSLGQVGREVQEERARYGGRRKRA
jgi:predicted nucleic acid-binding protein